MGVLTLFSQSKAGLVVGKWCLLENPTDRLTTSERTPHLRAEKRNNNYFLFSVAIAAL